MSTTADDRANVVAPPNEEPQPFQFRIRDVLIVTTLAALLLGGFAQAQPGMLLAFAVTGLLVLFFVWRLNFGTIALICIGFIVFAFVMAPTCYTPPEVPRRMLCGNQIHSIGLALQ